MTVDEIFEMIRKALESERPAQAYLIIGPIRGEATELAVKILQTLFCSSTSKPCGVCDGCRKVAGRIEVDAHWVFPEKKSRVISVDQVREKVLAPMGETSFGGGWKAVVLVGADRLQVAAANAFLKTLEEPSPKTLFLLLSDAPQQLLPTIVSRCQRIDLMDVRELAEPWKGRVLGTLAGPLLTNPVERMAVANMLLSILGDMKKSAEKLVREENAKEKERGEVIEEKDVLEAKVSARYREMRRDFLTTLVRWFRDLMILVAGGDESLVYNQSYLETLKERAGHLKLHQALYNMKAVEELNRQFEENMNEEHVLTYAIDRLQHGVPSAKKA